LGGLIAPLTKLIDEVHTSEEEKARVRSLIFDANAKLTMEVLRHEQEILEQKAEVIRTEAKGESWLQRNWRPSTMLFFVFLIGSYWLGFAPAYLISNPDVVQSLFTLVTVGLGGYVGGRSAEKIAPHIADAFKNRGS